MTAEWRVAGFALALAVCLGGGARAAAFQVVSPDIVRGKLRAAQLYDDARCKGGNVSPALRWNDAPAGTKSFAVSVYDPDARGGFWHWVVFDIPARVNFLPRDAGRGSRHLPKGAVQLRNDWGGYGYGGPCPPRGESHRYVFTVYALNVAGFGGLGAKATVAQVGRMVAAHMLAAAGVVAQYP